MAKILIIEDDMDLALVLRRNLESRGFKAVVAYDSIQGTKMAHLEQPNLIILDLNLPAGGGVTTLKNVRLSVNTAAIPVLILSGTDNEALKAQAQQEGADAFMRKPYELDDLVLTINGLLKAPDETA